MTKNPQNSKNPLLREGSVTFFGKTTAGSSHELRKVLEEIEHMAAELEESDCPDAMRDRIRSIRDEAAAGRAMALNLNRFSRTVASQTQITSAKEAADILAGFGCRLASCRGSELVYEQIDKAVTVLARPFALLHLLSCCLDEALNLVDLDGVVRFGVTSQDDLSAFVFTWEGRPLSRTFPDSLVQGLADSMLADLRSTSHSIHVWLPNTSVT